jgi:hypothetical protein
MINPFDRLAKVVTTHPLSVAATALIIFIIALYGMTLVTMQTGNEAYIDKNTPRGALLSHYTETYGSNAIMIIVEADDVTNIDTLWYIDQLVEEFSQKKFVSKVSGITTLLKGLNQGILPYSSAEVNTLISHVPSEIINRNLPSNMMTLSVIVMEPGLSDDRQKQVLSSIRGSVASSNPPPGVSVTVSGEPAFEEEMGKAMSTSMGSLILAAMVLMIVAVLALFSHVRYTLLPVVVVICGLILTFGLMGLTRTPVSMVVIGAFPVLIGIGIDYAIQIHARLDEEIYKTSLIQAVTTTITKACPSVMIAMLATSTGFIAMIFGPIPMVGDFGIVCTFGVVSCYIAAIIIVPVFAILMKYRGKGDDYTHSKNPGKSGKNRESLLINRTSSIYLQRYDALLGNVACFIAKRPVPVLLCVFIIAIIGFNLDNEVPISADQKTFVPSDMPALLDMNKVTRTMGATNTIPIIVSGDMVTNPYILSWIKDFGEYVVRSNDKITGISSIATLISAYNNGTLPTTESGIREITDIIPADAKTRYLNGNMETVLEFSLSDMEIAQARGLIKTIRQDVEWFYSPPGVTVAVTGSLEMFSTLMDDIQRSKLRMTLLGFGFILIFLLLVYRRIHAVSPLIPIVIIVGWNGAIMYLSGLDYTPLTAVLGSMTIGVASEYTILIMERCDEELAKGVDIFQAIETSVQKIGTAITVSGLTTVFGFTALMLSEFNIVSNFGITTVITVGFSLAGAILIMPAVIVIMYRFDKKHNYTIQVSP